MSVVLIEVAYSINDDNERKEGLDYIHIACLVKALMYSVTNHKSS